MPIPKPKAGEPRNAYISRCMGDDKMVKEYEQDQRAAVCNTTWRQAKMAADDNETFTFDAEILAEGKWNNIPITRKIMDQMVTNFRKFQDILDVPLKFGHNDEQQMTDGQPALGWISDLWINDAGKMMARLTDMPKIVYNAVKAKRYKNVSIEASLEVTHKGKDYGAVLTGLALLGADIPAVNTLNDLQTYMSAQNDLEFSQCANFSATSGALSTSRGDSEMDHEKEIAELKAKLAASEAEKARFAAEAKALEKARKDAEFKAEVESVKGDLDELVKDGKITPASRDEFLANMEDEVAVQAVKMSVAALSKATGDKGLDTEEQGREHTAESKDEQGMPADQRLFAKAKSLSIEKGITFSAAVDMVMLEDEKLAREYRDQFDKEVA